MTAPVSLISPLTITAGMITSSTAVTHSTTEPEWAAGTSYSRGQVVFRTPLGRRFENQIAGINSNEPEDDADRWYDLGETNSTTMFDSEVSTQAIADGTLTTVFRPGAFNAMYLGALDGTSLSITIKDAPDGETIYHYSGSLEDSQPADYYEYFFSPFEPVTDFLVTDLAPYGNCEVTISIDNPGGIAKCGIASLGDLVSLGGPALSGVTVEPKSYARVTTDERGKTRIRKGKAALDLTISALVPLADADGVVDALVKVLGVPAVCIGTDLATMRTMRAFGLVNGKLTYGRPTYATLNLTVEGMI